MIDTKKKYLSLLLEKEASLKLLASFDNNLSSSMLRISLLLDIAALQVKLKQLAMLQ